jgi:23S rRNA (uracil-5-)-methyltransferase RumA
MGEYTMKLIEKQKLKLNIRKQGINGEGIGYFNRIAVFVPGAIRKEVVHVEVEKVYDRYAIAKLIEIERPSKKRVMPPCKFFEQCGRCELQHIDYLEQLKIKQLTIEQSFKRYTSLNDVKDKVDLTLNDGRKENYSLYQELVLKNTNFGLALGYYKPMTNHFVYIDHCLIQDSEINDIAKLTLKLFRKYKLKAYDFRNKEGILHNLVIRYFKDTDQASVVIVVRKKQAILNKIAKEMTDSFQSIKSVGISIHNPDSQLVIYNPVEVLSGEDQIQGQYHHFNINVSPKGYFPPNKSVYEMMDTQILKYAALSEEDTIFNLYEGSTISSLFFSKYVNKVYGVDYDQASYRDGLMNLDKQNMNNVFLIQDHVEAKLPVLFKEHKDVSTVILNAPKCGISKTTSDLLNKYKPEQIVYVSQNPSTLAKDIDGLMDNYRVRKIIPVDVMPQTSRIDSLSFLEKK